MRTTIIRLILSACLLCLVSGCKDEKPPAGPLYGTKPLKQEQRTFSFAVHPLHNPARLNKAYQPLVDYLNSHLPDARIELEASRDYATFENKLKSRQPALILPNPWQTLQSINNGYHVIATAGDPEEFRGLFITRLDSGIKIPSDLINKTVSYPSPTALAACIMPQFYLHQQGIDMNRQVKNIYVGSQESSIMNAYLGRSAVAATWPVPWRAFQKEHPEEAAKLKVIWQTPHLINNSVMVRDDLPEELAAGITDLLLGLNSTEQGKKILSGLEISRFIPATDADYDQVRRYVERFEKEVRPVVMK